MIIYTNGAIATISGQPVTIGGFPAYATQDAAGTKLYTAKNLFPADDHYVEYHLPHKRYCLATDKPASGRTGLQQFFDDIAPMLDK